ncbi:hypothetical protein Tco_0044294, partial [Tanacetum coccineum]
IMSRVDGTRLLSWIVLLRAIAEDGDTLTTETVGEVKAVGEVRAVADMHQRKQRWLSRFDNGIGDEAGCQRNACIARASRVEIHNTIDAWIAGMLLISDGVSEYQIARTESRNVVNYKKIIDSKLILEGELEALKVTAD